MEGLKGSDLLNAISKESEINDEYERQNASDGIRYASVSTVILCVALFTIEAVIKRHPDFGKPTILLCFAGIWDVYEGKKNIAKGMFARGVIELIMAVILLILFVGALFV